MPFGGTAEMSLGNEHGLCVATRQPFAPADAAAGTGSPPNPRAVGRPPLGLRFSEHPLAVQTTKQPPQIYDLEQLTPVQLSKQDRKKLFVRRLGAQEVCD